MRLINTGRVAYYKILNKNMNKFLTTKEVANIFNVSEISVRRLMNKRKISFTQIRGSTRYSEDDINQFLEDNYWDCEKHHKINI